MALHTHHCENFISNMDDIVDITNEKYKGGYSMSTEPWGSWSPPAQGQKSLL
jgi:hypothetical protein